MWRVGLNTFESTWKICVIAHVGVLHNSRNNINTMHSKRMCMFMQFLLQTHWVHVCSTEKMENVSWIVRNQHCDTLPPSGFNTLVSIKATRLIIIHQTTQESNFKTLTQYTNGAINLKFIQMHFIYLYSSQNLTCLLSSQDIASLLHFVPACRPQASKWCYGSYKPAIWAFISVDKPPASLNTEIQVFI